MTTPTPFARALSAIDAAHALDPSTVTTPNSPIPIPSELHYAQKSTSYLSLRCSSASDALRLAVRAQHFRRWEVPRSSYPMTRVGYHAWRTYLKKRQAEMVRGVLEEAYAGAFDSKEEEGEFLDRVGGLMRKEGLGKGDGEEEDEVGVLEDVACLVFLEDQFEGWVRKWENGTGDDGEEGVRLEDEKVVGILRKTWGKMTPRGREIAREIPMEGRARELLGRALGE